MHWTQEDQQWSERMKQQLAREEECNRLLNLATALHMQIWEEARSHGWHPNEEMLNQEGCDSPLVQINPRLASSEISAWNRFHIGMMVYHLLQKEADSDPHYRSLQMKYHQKQLARGFAK